MFEWTFLLVMLHTGTMFSVLIYFLVAVETAAKPNSGPHHCDGLHRRIGFPLKYIIEKYFLNTDPERPTARDRTFVPEPAVHGVALAAVGVIIIVAGLKDNVRPGTNSTSAR